MSVTDEKAWNRSLWNLIGSQSLSGESVDEYSALTYSAVYNAISLISGTVGSLPLHLFREQGEKKVLVKDEKLSYVMMSKPNPYMTAMAFRETSMSHILAWGNAYAEKVKNGIGEIVELWPITPDRVRLDMQDNELIYKIKVGNVEKPFTREKILHIPGLGFDGFTGYSVVAMARKSIGLGMAMETFGSLYFGNGTHPGVVLKHPGVLTNPARDNLKESFATSYSGLGKSHGFVVLEEGLTIEKIGIPPEDSQFLECVTPETLFTMSNGSRKAAKDIRIGDNVIGWENGETTISHVSAIGPSKKKNLIRIKTARGRELTASEDHPCLVIQKLRTPGCRLHKKDPAKWIPIKDLKIGNYVRIAIGIPNIETPILTLTVPPNWMGFRKGYFLGAMAGDGYVRKGACSFTNANSGVIAYMQEVMQSLGGILKPRGHELNEYNHDVITNGKRGRKGSTIRNLLNDSGMVGQHSDTKTVPNSVLVGGQGAWKGFLSGYFDTDGSIRKKDGKQTPAMYWSSTSLKMLQDCQHLLANLGIQSAIYSMYPGGIKKVMGKECECFPSWGLYVMGTSQIKKAAETLKLAHTEKSKRLNQYLDAEDTRYREENFLYDRIISIEELGEGETIGIEVAGCHTHITAGIVTHNSRQFQIPEVARWFNLPPHKLKDLTRSSFNNIESEQISFVTDSILPWLIRLEQNYNIQLLTENEQRLERLYFKHNVEGLLRGDAASRGNFYRAMFGIGGMSINQILAKEDMDPLETEFADEHFVPLNMVPLSMIREMLEKGIKNIPSKVPGDGQNEPQ